MFLSFDVGRRTACSYRVRRRLKVSSLVVVKQLKRRMSRSPMSRIHAGADQFHRSGFASPDCVAHRSWRRAFANDQRKNPLRSSVYEHASNRACRASPGKCAGQPRAPHFPRHSDPQGIARTVSTGLPAPFGDGLAASQRNAPPNRLDKPFLRIAQVRAARSLYAERRVPRNEKDLISTAFQGLGGQLGNFVRAPVEPRAMPLHRVHEELHNRANMGKLGEIVARHEP